MAASDPPARDAPRPARTLPTLATVQASLDAVLRELRGARLDIESLKGELRGVRGQLADTADEIKISFLPKAPTAPPTPVPESRPSMAAKAGKATTKVGKWVFFGLGLAASVAQILAAHTNYRGPLLELLRVLGSLGGQQ